MHVGRRKRGQESGAEHVYLFLRYGYRGEGGRLRERTLYLGPESAEDIEDRARAKLRKVGYTPAEIREVLAAIRARVERNENYPILVRNRSVKWRDPPERA